MKLHLRRHIRGLQHCIWLARRVCSEGKIHQIIHQISSKSEKVIRIDSQQLTYYSHHSRHRVRADEVTIDPVRCPLRLAGGNQSLGKIQLPKNQTKRQYQGRGHSSSGSHHSPNICDGQLQTFIGIEGFREEVLRKGLRGPSREFIDVVKPERALQLPAQGLVRFVHG